MDCNEFSSKFNIFFVAKLISDHALMIFLMPQTLKFRKDFARAKFAVIKIIKKWFKWAIN